MREDSKLLIFVTFVALLTICYGQDNVVNKNCYQWKGCKTWWNETRGRCESICEDSDKYKRGTVDCYKPCLSNGFCRGVRKRSNFCLCQSVCETLPYCQSWVYEDCAKWGEKEAMNKKHLLKMLLFLDDPCTCVVIDPWSTKPPLGEAQKKTNAFINGRMLDQDEEVRS